MYALMNFCREHFWYKLYIVELKMYFLTRCFRETIVNYGSKYLKDDNIEKW